MSYEQTLRRIHAALRAPGYSHDVRGDVIELMRLEAGLDASQGNSTLVAQRHPLGFFACRWPVGEEQTLRLHLWSNQFRWAQEPGWEIHDHVFSFTSLLLLGALRNRVYEISDAPGAATQHYVYEVVYDGATSSMRLIQRGVSLTVSADTIESHRCALLYGWVGCCTPVTLLSDRAVTVLATCAQGTSPSAPRVVSAHQRHSVAFDRTPMSQPDVSALLLEFANYLERPSARWLKLGRPKPRWLA